MYVRQFLRQNCMVEFVDFTQNLVSKTKAVHGAGREFSSTSKQYQEKVKVLAEEMIAVGTRLLELEGNLEA